jgi:ketosteroid isomerase-like protein
MKLRCVLIVLLMSLFVACSQQTPAPVSKPDLAMEEKAIRDTDAQWLKAVQNRDLAAGAAMFASDGVAYREHMEPLVGPAAIQAFNAKDLVDNPKSTMMWTTDSVLIAESGELAIQTGQYHLTGLGPKGDREDKGRFVTGWKKVGNEWKVAYDIGSTTMPEPPPAKK